MNISIIGAGYIGLVTSVCLAEMGQKVTCIDRNEFRLQQIIRSGIPFQEPCLESLLRKNITLQQINFSSNYVNEIKVADVIYITGDTHRSADSEKLIILEVTSMVNYLKHNSILIFKTSLSKDTKAKLNNIITNHSRNKVKIVYNPVVLRKGLAIQDFYNKENIVVDSDCEFAKMKVLSLYQPLLSV